MATSSAEIPEVMVGGKHVSIEELDNLRDAVCLLKWQSKDKSKQWSGYGFYANVKTKKQGTTLDINCIITIYDDIFLEMEEHGSDMVAVFHRESDKKEAFDLPLVPFNLLAHGGTLGLDYALIFIDESKMKAKGVKPILADGSELPDVQPNDEVHMIHHPGTLKKHYSEDKARNVTRHCIRYHAKTLEGPPGSPVFVFRDSKFLLVAMHCNNKRKGVLVSYILDDLHIPSVLSKLPEPRQNPFVRVLCKLPEPRQNPFVRALSWALSWLSPSFLLAPFMRPTHGHVFHSGGSVLSWPSFSPPRGIRYGSSSYGEVVPSTRTRPILSGSAAPQYETSGDSSSDDFSMDDEDSDFDGFSLDNEDVRFRSSSYGEDIFIGTSRLYSLDDEGTKLKEKGEWERSRSDQISKMITVDGGTIETDDFTLIARLGCLSENTDIIVERVDHQFDILKSLIDLGLVHAAPRVVKFSPDGLKFLKPVDLKIKFDKTLSVSKSFILHGFYNPIYQRISWELVTNGVEVNDEEGVIHVKMNSFSLYMFILSTYTFLARILSHINQSFICLAYCFYRRSPSMNTIDIAVVLVSEFLYENEENNIKHLLAEGFIKGEKGVLKRVNTYHHLEMCLHFPGVETRPYPFQIDQSLLDYVGFVIDHFRNIAVMGPAHGEVKISEKQEGDENKSLWILNVHEENEEIEAEVAQGLEQTPSPEILEVVNRTTKLTNGEIAQIGREVGIDWDNLAALMNIPYSQREEIRVSDWKYSSFSSRAKHVLKLFSDSERFDRNALITYLEELKRHDIKMKMLPMDDQSESEEVGIGATATSQPEIPEVQLQNDTTLSSREMYRLSRHLVVDWDVLAGLLGIATADRNEARYSNHYYTSHSRAEKILAIFNNMEDFSRQKLAKHLEEMGQLELKDPVINGEWRKLIVKTI